jgi:hypothetical protein
MISTFLLFILVVFFVKNSISKIVVNSIILFSKKEVKIECVQVINKEISKVHGVDYYIIVKKIENMRNVKVNFENPIFDSVKSGDSVRIKYYSIGNIIKYIKANDIITKCHSAPSYHTNNP